MSAAYPKINFWDNLIPLRSGLDGPQLAGWTPGPPAKSGLGCVLYADQMIPVDDGVSLAADVYTPEVKGRYPAILVFSAYNKELQSSGAPTGTNETGSPSVFTECRFTQHIEGEPNSVTAKWNGARWILSVQCKVEIPDLVHPNKTIVAGDFGLVHRL